MADFQTKLQWLSERGNPVGAEELIERIEAELAGDPLVVVTKRREGRPMTKTQQPPTTNQPRRYRGPAWAVAAFVAVLAVAGIYLAFTGDEPDIAGSPDDPVAMSAAFVEAYTTGDSDTAAAMLAPDAHFQYVRLADTGSFSGDFSDLGVDGLSLIARFDEAVGMTWLPGPCELQGSTTAGSNVVCPYDFHGFHSEERGLGPYSGSVYRIRILDGKITSFIDIPHAEDEEAWTVENWDAFNTWGRETHPEDWATLDDEEAIASLIASSPDEAFEMYERLMQGFVEFENGGS
jgi:hypothetical protein